MSKPKRFGAVWLIVSQRQFMQPEVRWEAEKNLLLRATGSHTEGMPAEIANLFLSHSEKTLRKMTDHIELCLTKLTDEQLWARNAPNENSVGNLVLHLCGNVQQWIVAGVGGAPDKRNRDAEFAAAGGLNAAELGARLGETVDEAIRVLGGVTAERLAETINPQDGPVSVLDAVYHVVGHFRQHTGQIIFATKIYGGEDLALYRPNRAHAG